MEHQADALPTAKEDGSCQIQPIFCFPLLCLVTSPPSYDSPFLEHRGECSVPVKAV